MSDGVNFPGGMIVTKREGGGARAHLLVLFLFLFLDAAGRGQPPASLELEAALHDVLVALARRHGECGAFCRLWRHSYRKNWAVIFSALV